MNCVEQKVGVEAIENDAASLPQKHRQDEAAGGVRHRRDKDKRLTVGDAEFQHLGVVRVVPGAVREHHAFGATGRAAGEIDAGDILRLFFSDQHAIPSRVQATRVAFNP